MSNTRRESSILAIIAKLAEATVANYYNTNCGQHVFRCRQNVDPSELSCFVVWPMPETAVREYGKSRISMQLRVEGLAEFGAINPSVIAEQMLGDIIEVMTGIKWTLPFTSGGTYEIKPGDTITGHTSGASALVTAVSVTSGTWAGGDARGNLTLRRLKKEYQGENLDVGTNLNVATISGAITGVLPESSTCGGYADAIEYDVGGVDSYPDEGHLSVGVYAVFRVSYITNKGDPYNAE